MEKVPHGFIKVYWLKAHFAFAYSAGQTGIIRADKAPALLEKGFITILPQEDDVKVNPLPQDLPGRVILFDAGYDSLEKIRKAGDSLLDEGISNTTLRKIKSYLK